MAVVNGAHSDGQNQQFGILGVIGTLGTADVQGTAPTLPIGVNPDTGAVYVQDLSGASGTTNVQGSVQVTGGSIVVTAGTVSVGSISSIGQVHNAGTIADGTLAVVSNLTNGSVRVTAGTITSGSVSVIAGTIGAGTINTLGTVSNILAGTIQNSGTVTGVGVVSALTSGTVSVNTAGTITSGTVAISLGTIGGKAASGAASVANPVLIAGTDSGGTVYAPLVDTAGHWKDDIISGTITSVSQLITGTIANSGTTTGVGVVSNITNGSIRVTAGTMIQTIGTVNSGTMNTGTLNSGTINAGTFTMTVGTLNSGTVNAGTINSGTINTGTINAGTMRIDPLPVIDTISSVGTTGTTAIGTLIGTATIGVGTGVYITGYHILAISGTPEINLSFGTQKVNNQVIAHGLFPAGGGIARDKSFAHAYGTTQSPLTYEIVSGAGTVSWSVDYFLHT